MSDRIRPSDLPYAGSIPSGVGFCKNVNGDLLWDGGGTISAISSAVLPKPLLPDVSIKSAYKKLTPPSPYNVGNNAQVHPQLLLSKTNFGGYKYWLCYTPYPDGNSAYENPVVVASNDLISWESPTKNPLVQQPLPGYNADTSIAFNADETTLYLIYRERTSGTNYLRLMHTTDGKSWSTPVAIKTGTTAGQQDYACPSMWWNPDISKWEIITHNLDASAAAPFPIQKHVSSTADPYGAYAAAVTVNVTPTSGQTFWHSHFLRLSNGSIVAVISENPIGGAGTDGYMYVLFSPDGINFSKKAVNFNLRVYRPSIWIDDNDACRLLISKLNTPYLIDCDLFEYQEYEDYKTDIAARLAGTKFSFARDTFNRADSAVTLGNSESGQVWGNSGGAMGISTNRAYNVTTGNTRSFLTISSTNAHVRMKIAQLAGGGTWFILRRQDDNNYCRIGFINNTPTSFSFQTIESGSIVVNKTITHYFDYSVANEFHVKLNGSKITVGMNNCNVYEDTLEKFLGNTSFGFQFAGTTGYIDEFMAIPL